MKRMVSKIFCVIMALCVFLGAMPIASFAENEKPDGYVVVENVDATQFSPGNTLPETDIATDGFTANKFYGNTTDPDSAYLFYNQLNDNQKQIYSDFILAGVSETFEIDCQYSAEGSTVTVANENLKAIMAKEIAEALTAAVEDNPYYYWVSGFGYSYSYSSSRLSNGFKATTAGITIEINLDLNSYTDFADVETKLVQLAEAVQAAPINGITRYEKVKSIHDYICSINEYPDQQGTFSDGTPWYGPMAHQPTGVFLKGLAVCEGYAEAFKLLCDREGIPCITVLGYAGGPHKWNYVKMEDGNWYLVDATWNDQSSLVFNDYLLCGTSTMTPHFENSTPDSEVHIPDGAMYNGVTPLQYPTHATDSYGMMMLNNNVGDVTVEDSMNVIFVGKDITDLENSFILPNGFSGTVTSFTDVTGGKLTVTKTSTGVSKTYMFAKRGDIDGSNTTNTTDYNKVVTASTAGSCPTKNTAEFYAGDINHDGAIDGFDAIALDLYLDDTLKFE